MNRLISLFALVAVAFAEPDAQYLTYGAPLVYAHHGNAHATAGLVQHPSGAVTPDETASVKAAKAQHHAAKVNEYLKKPFVYAAATPVVAAAQPVVYSKPAVTYTHQVAAPVTYTHQVAAPVTYTHHLLKREAESDSQYLYNSAYTYPYAAAATTTYGAYAGYPYTTYGAYAGYPYTTYAGYHHLYKRDAEADSQYFYNSAYTYPYAATTYGAYAGYPYSTYAGVYGGAYRYGYPYVY